MSRQTLIRTRLPASPHEEAEEIWTILTHEADNEWWSEILDGHRHPYVRQDEYGYDTVQKFYGDTVEESKRAALGAVEELVRQRGGRVEGVGETKTI